MIGALVQILASRSQLQVQRKHHAERKRKHYLLLEFDEEETEKILNRKSSSFLVINKDKFYNSSV